MDINRVKESLLGVTNPKDQWKILMLELIEYHKEIHPHEELTKEDINKIIGNVMEMMVSKGAVQIDEDGKYMVPNINIMTDA